MLSHRVSNGLWATEERCAGVGDHICGLGAGVASNSNRVHFELEVGGRGEWHEPTDLGSTVGGVHTSVGENTAGNIVGRALLLQRVLFFKLR